MLVVFVHVQSIFTSDRERERGRQGKKVEGGSEWKSQRTGRERERETMYLIELLFCTVLFAFV